MEKSIIKEVLKKAQIVKFTYEGCKLPSVAYINCDFDVNGVLEKITEGWLTYDTLHQTEILIKYDLTKGVYLYKDIDNIITLYALINDKGVFVYE